MTQYVQLVLDSALSIPLAYGVRDSGCDLRGGEPCGTRWQEAAYLELMRPLPRAALLGGAGPDCVCTDPLVVSERLKALLEDLGTTGLEFLPIAVRCKGKVVAPGPYHLVHRLPVVDAVDLTASGAELPEPHLQDVRADVGLDEWRQLVLKAGAIPPGALLFRLRHLGGRVFVTLPVAQALLANDLRGCAFYPLEGIGPFGFSGPRVAIGAATRAALRRAAPPAAAVAPVAPPRSRKGKGVATTAVPSRLADWLARNVSALEGRYLAGLPFHDGASKTRVEWLAVPSQDLLDAADAATTYSTHLVLARLKGHAELLVVDTADERLPVSVWEHETGELFPLAPSLEELAPLLLGKGDKTPLQLVKSAVAAAGKLGRRSPEAALEALAAIDAARLPRRFVNFEDGAPVRAFFNERGQLLVAVGRLADGLADFRTAMTLEDELAALNLIDALLEHGRAGEARTEAEALLGKRWLDEYVQFHALNYRALACVVLGELDAAREAYRALTAKLGAKGEHVEEARADLAALAESVPAARTLVDEELL